MRKAVVLMALTFLFYAGVATAFSTADFVKIDVDGQTFYTQPELQNSDFIIASDRIFYGSDIGRVDINFLVKTRVDNQTFSWGIETRGKEIEVQTVKEGRSQKMGEIFIDSKKPILKEEWESFSATLFFNPQEIGLAEEFDIILYDDTGKEVARLDPVLSGFSFYQEITLATATFGLSANVTNDHTVPIFINPTDTNFWSNETWHDGNGIQFTDVNGVQDYNFAWEDFNATSKLAVAHLDINDTFTKDTNVIVRMYFKGANTSYTDAAPYPSTYLAAYYFNESSGNLVDRTANGRTGTVVGSPSYRQSGQINGSVKSASHAPETQFYQLASPIFSTTDPSIPYSFYGWMTWEIDGANVITLISQYNGGDANRFILYVSGGSKLIYEKGGVAIATSGTSISQNTLAQVAFTKGSDQNTRLYINGAYDISGIDNKAYQNISTELIGDSAAGSNLDYNGIADGFRIFDYKLSDDEIKLLYNLDRNSQTSHSSTTFLPVTYSNYNTYASVNYTKTLGYDVNYSCASSGTISLRINGVNVKSSSLTCDSVSHILSTFYTRGVDGNTTADINQTIGGVSTFFSPIQMTWDTVAPSIVQTDYNIMNVSKYGLVFRCTDSVSPQLRYAQTDNNIVDFNYLDLNNASLVLNNYDLNSFGKNAMVLFCTDLAGNTTTSSENIYSAKVLKPLDNETLALLTPFSFTTTGASTATRSGLVADTTFSFVGLTSSLVVGVDANSDYTASNYTLDLNRVDTNFIIQPYLLRTVTGTSIKFIVENANRDELPGIFVEIYQSLNNNQTLVASGFTDITGSILWFLTPNVTYTVKFYNGGVLQYSTDNYVVISTPVYWYFNLAVGRILITTPVDISVTFSPPGGYVSTSTTQFIQRIVGTDLNWAVIRFYQYQNGDLNSTTNTIYSISQSCTSLCIITTNISSLTFDSNFALFLDVNAFTDNNTIITSFKTQYTRNYPTSMNITQLALNVRRSFGCDLNPIYPCAWGSIVALILTIFALGAVVIKMGFSHSKGLAILAMAILGIFTYIGWFYWVVYIFLLITVLLGMRSSDL